MVVVLHDGLRIFRLFTSVVNSLISEERKKEVSIIYLQTGDFREGWLVNSPGLASIVRRLMPRPMKYETNFTGYLKSLEVVQRDWPDFELSLFTAQTLWLLRGGNLEDFYDYISNKLKLKSPVIPLMKGVPDIRLKVKEKEEIMTVYDYINLERIGEVIDFKFESNGDNLQLTDKANEAIKDSDFILLFQLSPLTIYFLSKINNLKKIVENYGGHIGYILPHDLSLGDRKIIEKYYDGEITNLINSLEGAIDIVIFDKNYYKLISQLQDIDITLYPLSFEDGKSTDYKKSVDEIIRIIESEL